MKLPEHITFIISEINKNGERADVVGGCVRDFLLGFEPDDFDLTTSASPEKTKEIFSSFKTVDTGIKHGTVTLLLDSESYEITTYRIDGEYKDNRHPDSVTFSKNIEDDLSRRDFTMNAIAFNPKDGITDPYGGQNDIKNSLIRAVGDARVRFTEDALRILRAVRFSSRLGFKIEKDTAKALVEKRELLSNVSSERIFSEWKKLLEGDFAARIIEEFFSVICVFLPEISSPEKRKIPDFSSLSVAERNVLLFYISSSSPESFSSAMRRLKTDNEFRVHGASTLECLYRISEKLPNLTLDWELTMLLHLFGKEATLSALKIHRVLGKDNGEALEKTERLLADGVPYRISDLAVNGNDLLKKGVSGRDIGRTLDILLHRVMSGELENEKDSLISAIT